VDQQYLVDRRASRHPKVTALTVQNQQQAATTASSNSSSRQQQQPAAAAAAGTAPHNSKAVDSVLKHSSRQQQLWQLQIFTSQLGCCNGYDMQRKVLLVLNLVAAWIATIGFCCSQLVTCNMHNCK